MQTVTLDQIRMAIEARDVYGNAIPFSIVFVTCDRAKRTGGKLMRIPCAVKHANLQPRQHDHQTRMQAAKQDFNKYPTVNLAVVALNKLTGKHEPTNQIVRCHFRLITHFNDIDVTW